MKIKIAAFAAISVYLLGSFSLGVQAGGAGFELGLKACNYVTDKRSRGYMLMSVKRSVDAEPLTPKLYDVAVMLGAVRAVDNCLQQSERRAIPSRQNSELQTEAKQATGYTF